MAYGEKYKYYFYWDHDSSNNYYKVSFLFDGYAAGVTELTPTAVPWLPDIKGQLDTSENPILGSSASMNIIADGADYTTYDTDFLESDYKDGIVKLIQDPDGTPIVKWVGILQPTNASRTYLGEKKIYSLSAVDGLADLKNKSYSTTGLNDGSPYAGFEDFLTIIKTALATVADFTELQLDFRINLGTYSDQMTNVTGLLHTDQALKDNEVVQELFSEVKDNETKFNSCYEVLEKILIAFDCTMMQDEGYYYIICTGEKNTSVWEYDWATLTEQSRTAWTKSVNAVSYKWLTKGTLYKTPPYKTYDVRLYNKNYDAELAVNGGFDSNIVGWTLGDADDSSNGFSGISHVSGNLRAQWGGAAAAGNYHFHTTNSFTVDISSQIVTVTALVELDAATPGGIGMPNLRFRLWNATDLYTVGNNGYQAVTQIGGYYTYTETFDVSGFAVAANFLDVEAQVTDASTTSIDLFYDNISTRQASVETPADWLYTGLRSTVQPEPKEQILYVSEQQESDNDICAIKDIGGTYVSTWGRWNFLAETRSLIEILQQYRFNSNRGYMSYIRGTICDPDETITPKNVVTLTEGDFRIIGMQRDYRNGSIALDLIQIIYVGLFLPTDTTFGIGKEKLSSQYGESTE